MYIYILFLLIILILGIFMDKIGKDKYLIISFILMYLFIVLKKYEYYPDHELYKEIFDLGGINGLNFLFKNYCVEKGYLIYSYVISKITTNYNVFLSITAFISLIGPYYFIKYNSNNYRMSVILYILLPFLQLNYILRGSIALSLALLAINNLKKNELLKSIILIIIGGCFHKTILIFLPAFPFLKYIFSKKQLAIYGTLLAVLLLLKHFIVKLLIDTFYGYYDISDFAIGGYKLLILLIVLGIVIIFTREKLLKANPQINIFINSFLISILMQVFATEFGPINRITTYFEMSLIIILPEILSILKEKYKLYYELYVSILIVFLIILKMVKFSQLYQYHLLFI